MCPLGQRRFHVRELVRIRHAQAEPDSLKMDRREKRRVIEQGWNDGGGENREIVGPQHLGHDEGRRPHDRGHKLAAGTGRRFDGRTGIVAAKSHALHQAEW